MSKYEEFADLAEEIARKAGALLIARPQFFDLDEKSNVFDFATQMDHASEALIVSAINSARPGDGIVGEEGAAQDSTTGYTWVIDPIDGTVNYLYNLPGWCISIGVKDKDGAVAGVVYLPATDSLWRASRGAGASRNGKAIQCNDPVELNRALVATGFAYDLERRRIQAKFLQNLLPEIRDIRRLGACAADICMVASGMLDAYFEAGVNEWDHIAAALIAQEAGAKVLIKKGIWDGEKDLVVVAGPSLHAQLLDRLDLL